MNTKIEQLIRSKNYADLTPDERQVVAGFVSEKEYDAMRKLLKVNSLQVAAVPSPSPNIKANLQQYLANKQPKTIPIYARPIPLWQAGIAAAIVGMSVWFFLAEPKIIEVEKEVIIASIDTFYQEVEVPVEVEKVVVKEKTIYKNNYIDRPVYVRTSQPVATMPEGMENEVNLEDYEPRGRSIKEDSVIMDLLLESSTYEGAMN